MVQTAKSLDPRKGKKRTTVARCKNGFKCGITCINRDFACKSELQRGAAGLAGEIRRLIKRDIDQGDFSSLNPETRKKLINSDFIDEPTKGAIGAAKQSVGTPEEQPEVEPIDLTGTTEREKLKEEREQRKRERERRRRKEE